MNGDFDLFVLNGKIKELNEKISSINSSIDSIKTEFDDLNIGNPTDTGGSQTEGTVMGKLNSIYKVASEHQIGGKWVLRGNVTLDFTFNGTKTETKKFIIPAKSWFSYIAIHEGTLEKNNAITAEITICGVTYNIAATIIGGIHYSTFYMFTYDGFQQVHNIKNNNEAKLIDGMAPIIPIFPYFEEDTEITVTASNRASDNRSLNIVCNLLREG